MSNDYFTNKNIKTTVCVTALLLILLLTFKYVIGINEKHRIPEFNVIVMYEEFEELQLKILEERKVEKIVETALKKSYAFLPGSNPNIQIFPSTPENDLLTNTLGGVAGWYLGDDEVLIIIDPTIEGWDSLLSYVIAHEYHHVAYMHHKIGNKKFTLLDYLIFEGSADSFANMLYPNFHAQWTSNIDHETEKILWHKIKDHLDSTDNDLLLKVMFGDDEIFPHWSGYTIGYRIVQNYLYKNPKVTFQTLISMDSLTILKESGYSEELESDGL